MNFLSVNINADKKLIPRSEGKIKSYESCLDLRAWSHDGQSRDRHLREWIKRDMSICVLPVCTLASFLRTMTRRTRNRVAPRCHPDCKSKVLIDSLCNSCQAITECLKSDPSLEKYFVEEELYTSHWPCDRCLNILKSVKMFWKIIIEKIFGINLSKTEEFELVQDECSENIRSVAKVWENEIIQQTILVKNSTLSRKDVESSESREQIQVKKVTPSRITKHGKVERKDSICVQKVKQIKRPSNSPSSRTRTIESGKSVSNSIRNTRPLSYRNKHRCHSAGVKMMNMASTTSDIYENSHDITLYNRNIVLLEQKCNVQENEIEELKRENNSLKIELQNFYKTSPGISAARPILNVSTNVDADALVPKPFESYIEDCYHENILNNVDSEMIITMKKCRNESFKHVSLLQVLHKTNLPTISDEPLTSKKKENPIELLTKVKNTFSDIVKREIRIVTSRKDDKKCEIDATSCSVNDSKSEPSYTSVYTETSESNNCL